MSAVLAAAATIADPECQSTAPPQHMIQLHTANITVPGSPFGLVYAREDVAFVGLGHKVGMLDTAAFTPTLTREIAIPAPLNQSQGEQVSGLTLSHNKRYVYASIGPGAAIIDVEKSISGDANPVVGVLNGKTGDGAIQVTVSADDRFVFVTQEYGTNETRFRGTIEVFQMHRSRNGSISSTNKGYVTLGYAVVGTALSRDGNKLFVTSELTSAATSVNDTQGTISVLDVATLKTNPSKALLHTVDAGCSPVRLSLSRMAVCFGSPPD